MLVPVTTGKRVGAICLASLMLVPLLFGIGRNLMEKNNSDSLLGQWVGPIDVDYYPDGNRHLQPVHTRGVLTLTWTMNSVFTRFPKFSGSGSLFLQSLNTTFPVTCDHVSRTPGISIDSWARVPPVTYWHNGSFSGLLDGTQLTSHGSLGDLTFTGTLHKGTSSDFEESRTELHKSN